MNKREARARLRHGMLKMLARELAREAGYDNPDMLVVDSAYIRNVYTPEGKYIIAPHHLSTRPIWATFTRQASDALRRQRENP